MQGSRAVSRQLDGSQGRNPVPAGAAPPLIHCFRLPVHSTLRCDVRRMNLASWLPEWFCITSAGPDINFIVSQFLISSTFHPHPLETARPSVVVTTPASYSESTSSILGIYPDWDSSWRFSVPPHSYIDYNFKQVTGVCFTALYKLIIEISPMQQPGTWRLAKALNRGQPKRKECIPISQYSCNRPEESALFYSYVTFRWTKDISLMTTWIKYSFFAGTWLISLPVSQYMVHRTLKNELRWN